MQFFVQPYFSNKSLLLLLLYAVSHWLLVKILCNCYCTVIWACNNLEGVAVNSRLGQNIGHCYMIQPWTCLATIINMCVIKCHLEEYPYPWTLHYSRVACHKFHFIAENHVLHLKSPSTHTWSSSWDSSMELRIPRRMIYSSYFAWQVTTK